MVRIRRRREASEERFSEYTLHAASIAWFALAVERRRVECAGRKQGLGCTAPTFVSSGVEAQIEEVLTRFSVPAEEQERLAAAWSARQIKRSRVRCRTSADQAKTRPPA